MDQCADGAKDIFDKMNEAIHAFSQKSLSGVITGAEKMYEAIKEFPTEFSDCKAIKNQLVDLEAWIKKFAHPLTMAGVISKNMLFHAKTVYGDLSGGITAWNSKDFKNSGDKFGDALHVLTQ